MTNAGYIVIIGILLLASFLLLSAVGNAIRVRALTAQFNEERTAREAWETLATQRSNHAQNFLDAARILAIHTNGRLLNITVARGDKIFQIETMRLMSDDTALWRSQCGLDA